MESKVSDQPAHPEFLKYSMRSFMGIVEPLLQVLQPRSICEIGIEQGLFTDFLLNFCTEANCLYTGIDPAPPGGASPSARFLAGRSLDVLPGLPLQDVYFIDGDHNYYTVSNELKLILGRRPSRSVLLLHDVAYPWARRDMYHSPDAIPPGDRHSHAVNVGPVPGQEALESWGLGSKYGAVPFAVALKEGGPRNGVLTAVEDILRTPEAEGWRLLIVPAVFGLGVLFKPAESAAGVTLFIEKVEAACVCLGGLLTVMEEDRLRLFTAFLKGFEHGESLGNSYSALQKNYEALLQQYGRLDKHAADLLVAYHDLRRYTDEMTAQRDRLQEKVNRLEGR